MKNKISAFILALVILPISAFGWGQKGHDITADIAEKHLTPAAKEAVNTIFEGKSLVYWAAWLDSASNQDEWRYTKTWHYRNVDAGLTLETAPKNPDGDVLTAITSQSQVLMSPQSTKEERELALKIITHTVGDLNQPMHMGHASDRGGNEVIVKFFGRDSKLHSVWDSSILDSAHKWSYSEWTDQLDRLSDEQIEEILSGGLYEWGAQTLAIANKVYEYFQPGINVSYDAVFYWTSTIEHQLLVGGIRLAGVLNYIFDEDWRAAHPGLLGNIEIPNADNGVAIIAHRGFWNCEAGGYSHNSIASLKAAQAAGFAGSEFDVNMTADEKLLVYHDSKIDGKVIEKCNAAEFDYFRLPNGEKIPSLDEYIAQFKADPTCMMVLEIKKHSTPEVENRCVELCLDKLRAAGMLSPKNVMFISFSLNVCKTLAERLPKGYTVQYLQGNKSPKKLAENGINGLDYHYLLLNVAHPSYVAKAQKLNMSVNAWTVNKTKTMSKLLRKGVCQITTNEPLLLRELLKEKGLTEITRL